MQCNLFALIDLQKGSVAVPRDTGRLTIVTKVWFGATHSDAFQGILFNLGLNGSFLPLI